MGAPSRAVRRPGLFWPFIWLGLVSFALIYLGMLVYTYFAISGGFGFDSRFNAIFKLFSDLGLPIFFLSSDDIVFALVGLGIVFLFWVRALIAFLARLGRLAG